MDLKDTLRLNKKHGFVPFKVHAGEGKNPKSHQDHTVKWSLPLLKEAYKGDTFLLASRLPIPNCVVLDFDKVKKTGTLKKFIKAAGVDPTKITLAVRTGGGYHCYFKTPVDFDYKRWIKLKDKTSLTNKLDVRGHPNMYHIVPGCLHWEKKRHYEYVDNDFKEVGIQPLPKEIIDLFEKLLDEHEGSDDYITTERAKKLQKKSAATRGRTITNKNLRKILDQQNVEEYAGIDFNYFVTFVLALHQCTQGDPEALEIVIEWCMSDPHYNNKKTRRDITKYWNRAKLDKPASAGTGTVVKHLQDHSSIPHQKIRSHFSSGANREALVASMVNDKFARELKESGKSVKKKKKKKKKLSGESNVETDVIEILTNIDWGNPNEIDRIKEVLLVIDQTEDQTIRDMLHTAAREASGKTKKDYQKLILQCLPRTEDQATAESVRRVIKMFNSREVKQELMVTQGVWYQQRIKGVYSPTSENHIRTTVSELAENYYRTIDPECNINRLTNDVVSRLRDNLNVDQGFNEQVIKSNDENVISKLEDIEYLKQNRFTNDESLAIGNREVRYRLNNGELVIDISKAHKYKGNVNPHKKLNDDMTIDDMLLLDMDKRISKNVTVDHHKNDSENYYTRVVKADYLNDKQLKAAIKAGGLKHFTHLLKCLTADLSGKKKLHFVTAYLDALAYMISPIKNHNLFYVFYGQGDNGKSFSTVILESIFGAARVKQISLLEMADNQRFFNSKIKESYLIYDDDLNSLNNNMIQELKKHSVGGKTDHAEKKNQNVEDLYISKYCVLMLTNKMLSFRENNDAIKRRLYPLAFTSNIGKTFPRIKHGKPLLQKELSVIFNVLIRRLPRVVTFPIYKSKDMHSLCDQLSSPNSEYYTVVKHVKEKKGSTVLIGELHQKIQLRAKRLMIRNNIEHSDIRNILANAGYSMDDTHILDAKLTK